MGYYIRQLTRNDAAVPVEDIRRALRGAVSDADLQDVENEPWSAFVITRNGAELAVVTRELDDGPESLAHKEMAEFIEELDGVRPQNAARWLQAWLADVKCVYAFQILGVVQSEDDWNAVHSVRETILDRVGGITQADGEGFSNEDGYHIVWQFSDDVTGPWNVAVRDNSGTWRTFRMDLGDHAHRMAFWNGHVPDGL